MAEELDLTGHTAVVTGAGRNIGRAIVLELASHGANVVINARSNEAEAERVAEEARDRGVRALVVLGDASEPDTVRKLRDITTERFGWADIVVSNAARRLFKSFFDVTDEEWHMHLNMQLTASWYLAKAFAPGMRDAGWGRIIHINGPDGWHGGWTRVPHSVAKGGLRTLTKSLAAGLGEYGITVNDVVPSFAGTIRDSATHPQVTEAFVQQTSAKVPIRRQPAPEEIAWACTFLCSRRSDAITGTAIHVDGGRHMIG